MGEPKKLVEISEAEYKGLLDIRDDYKYMDGYTDGMEKVLSLISDCITELSKSK